MTADPQPKKISNPNDATLFGEVRVSSVSGSAPTFVPRTAFSGPTLALGTVLADRYEIVSVLGQGGMGAVYKARDLQLDRLVALKVIRPELADAEGMLERFKQELIVARQVTHKNVVRIYDLGEAPGLKFITMEFVEGRDLASILAERPLTPDEAVECVVQICRGLECAHSEGVIHRDLKPQNVMRDQAGRIVVMDFGLARSFEGQGMTQTGALVGTLEYMSPEQAVGGEVGPASDIFALGLIFFELLTGRTPYQAETAFGSLIKRTQERARAVSEIDTAIPRSLSNIVAKCLERDQKLRYQTAEALRTDLEGWQSGRRSWTDRVPIPRISNSVRYGVIGLVLLVVLGIGFNVYRQRVGTKASTEQAAVPSIALAIVPFRNASGDQALDWMGGSIADMLTTDVGQSAEMRMVSADRLNQVIRDLRITPQSTLDSSTLRRLADFTNADTIVWGQYARAGDRIRFDGTLHDFKHDRSVPLKAEATDEKQVLAMVDDLAKTIRENLALSKEAIEQVRAQAFKPSSTSVDALRAYSDGLQFARRGNHLDAKARFEAAIKADPRFALAYSRLGASYSALGYDTEAEGYSQKAVQLSEALPTSERLLIVANNANISSDYPKAIEVYGKLAGAWPDNVDVLFALGSAYENSGQFDKAQQQYARILKVDPKHVDALLASGRVEIKSGRPQDGLDYLNRSLSLAVQLQDEEVKAAILQAQGVAFKLLNRPQDALRNYQESLAIKTAIGQQRGIAVSLNEIAQVQEQLGKTKEAQASYEKALKVRREIGDKQGITDTLIDFSSFLGEHGRSEESLKRLKEALQLSRDTGSKEAEALCLNNIGSIYFNKGEYEDANTYFEQAYSIRAKLGASGDVVDTLHNLAETDAMMGRPENALQHYMQALEVRRSSGDERGAAMESLSLGTLFEDQGRYGAALKAKEEALKTFQDAKDRSAWMAQVLDGYGQSLADVGRYPEAAKSLQEGLSLARELKNDTIAAQILVSQGNAASYQGELKTARTLYTRALQDGSKGGNPRTVLEAKLSLAKIDLADGNTRAAAAALPAIVDSADRVGLRMITYDAQLTQAEVLLKQQQSARARALVQRVQLGAEKLGYRLLVARAHFLQAASGDDPEANYAAARQSIEEMKSESGTPSLLKRADLGRMYDQATRQLASTR